MNRPVTCLSRRGLAQCDQSCVVMHTIISNGTEGTSQGGLCAQGPKLETVKAMLIEAAKASDQRDMRY